MYFLLVIAPLIYFVLLLRMFCVEVRQRFEKDYSVDIFPDPNYDLNI